MTDHNDNRTIAIIGGGAAGLMAAAAAGHAGCRILLFDANDRLGRKIYATGNGRCNLTNLSMSDDYYNTDIMDILAPFDHEALIDYFRDRGVYMHNRSGYVYPRTDQAATIAEALVRDLQTCPATSLHLAERVTAVAYRGHRQGPADAAQGATPYYEIRTGKGVYSADRVILAAGGAVSKAYGCTGDGYRLAERLGHTVTTCTPALVPVYVEDPLLKIAAGVRCAARVTALVDGEEVAADTGELQITESGFSGIPVFQISRWLSQALAAGQRSEIMVNLVPDIASDELQAEITRRSQDSAVVYIRDVTAGLVHSKVGSYIARSAGLADEKKLAKLDRPNDVIRDLIGQLACCTYRITGTADYDKAQVTAGGVPFAEIDETFQSRKTPGLYLAGELLDVDGMCGGYNLTWAMCSGHLAGIHAAS